MSRSSWTLRDIQRGCGHGDNILATVHDPAVCWYWREVTRDRGVFNFDFKAKRGRVAVSPIWSEWVRRRASPGMLVIEPHVKASFSSKNKDWGYDRWQGLVDVVDAPWLQMLYPGARALRGVRTIETPTFDTAVAVLAQSRGLVSTNGGLQYAAAALRKPAVIVWGAFAPPEVLGYDDHWALSEPDPDGLGQRRPNAACRAAMDRITVDRVATAVVEMGEMR